MKSLRISKDLAKKAIIKADAAGLDPHVDENGDKYYLFSNVDKTKTGRVYLKDFIEDVDS